MLANREEVLQAALELSESDRPAIASRPLETVSEDFPGLDVNDAEFEGELERRFGDWNPTTETSRD